jgi:group I intron endonuclease
MKIIGQLPKLPGIYKITNLIDSKGYVGQAVVLYQRHFTHKGLLQQNKHKNPHMQAAVNRDELSNFSFEVIEILPLDKTLLTQREDYWIKFYKTNDPKFGYNMASAIDGHLGMKRSDSTREKLSLKRKGMILSIEQKQSIGFSVHKFYEANPELGILKVQKAQQVAADLHRGKSLPEQQRLAIQKGMQRSILEKGPEEVKRLKEISKVGANHSAEVRHKLAKKRLNLTTEQDVAYEAIYTQDKTSNEIAQDRKRFVRALEKMRKLKERN